MKVLCHRQLLPVRHTQSRRKACAKHAQHAPHGRLEVAAVVRGGRVGGQLLVAQRRPHEAAPAALRDARVAGRQQREPDLLGMGGNVLCWWVGRWVGAEEGGGGEWERALREPAAHAGSSWRCSSAGGARSDRVISCPSVTGIVLHIDPADLSWCCRPLMWYCRPK